MTKISVTDIILQEKKETPKCICGKEMIFDMIKGKFLCVDCENMSNFSDDRRLVLADIYKLKTLSTKSLINVVQLRECKYNYLYNTWAKAAKGDRKTEFFFNRMKDKERELDEIKEKGLSEIAKKERRILIKTIKKLRSEADDKSSKHASLRGKYYLLRNKLQELKNE